MSLRWKFIINIIHCIILYILQCYATRAWGVPKKALRPRRVTLKPCYVDTGPCGLRCGQLTQSWGYPQHFLYVLLSRKVQCSPCPIGRLQERLKFVCCHWLYWHIIVRVSVDIYALHYFSVAFFNIDGEARYWRRSETYRYRQSPAQTPLKYDSDNFERKCNSPR